jgi:hypothetical protein
LLGCLVACGASSGAESQREPRATMDEIFAQIRIVLPLSLDDETFADPENRERIAGALNALASRAEVLETHGRGRNAGFASLSQSLSRDAQSVAQRFGRGDPRSARFLFHRSLEACVACHSKLASENEFPMGRRLLENVDLSTLSVRQQARIQVVARQFTAALSSYERMFSSPQVSPARMAADRDLLSYLKIALTIENDPDRATAALMQLRGRKDIPPGLARDVSVWIRSISALQRDPLPGEPLDRARVLLRAGESIAGDSGTRAALVYNIEAWHELQRLVDRTLDPSPQIAEAYYLLGFVESRLFGDGWLSGAEAYLEASIRIGPTEGFARDAYALLEELIVLGYTGSSGTHVPSDVRARLEELERGLGVPSR